MNKDSWDKVKWRLIKNHLGYSKEKVEQVVVEIAMAGTD